MNDRQNPARFSLSGLELGEDCDSWGGCTTEASPTSELHLGGRYFPREDPEKAGCSFKTPPLSPSQHKQFLGMAVTSLFALVLISGFLLPVAAAYHVCLNQTDLMLRATRISSQHNTARAIYHKRPSRCISTKPRGLLVMFLLHFAPTLGAQPDAT